MNRSLFAYYALAVLAAMIAVPSYAGVSEASGAAVTQATGFPVYSGCSIPPVAVTGTVHYVDAVHGSPYGDGSSENPWQSLATVLSDNAPYMSSATTVRTDILTDHCQALSPKNGLYSRCLSGPLLTTQPYYHDDPVTSWGVTTNPNAPIKPGDTIYVRSGNYGDVVVGTGRGGAINSDFITVAADPANNPNEPPILTSLTVGGNGTVSTKWVFTGFTIQSTKNGYAPHAAIYGNDIIFANNHLMSAPNITTWTQQDWFNEGRWMGIHSTGTCVSAYNNLIENVIIPMGVSGSNVLVADNTLRYFGWDGIDVGANNILIYKNKIIDHIGVNDAALGWHSDAIQLQANDTNVTIDSNYIVKQTQPTLPWPGASANLPNSMQGIDDFGNPKGSFITVSNNVIITGDYNGINFSAPGTKIINNTVLSDQSTVAGTQVWITANGSGSIIRNNISSMLSVGKGTNVTVDHNITSRMQYFNPSQITKAGVYTNNNIVDPNLNTDLFNQFVPDPTKATFGYDLTLAPTAVGAIGMGNPAGAPSVDINGITRQSPPDLGAYAYFAPYKGTISILATARQIDTPTLVFKADGKQIGSINVTADVHYGQLKTYTFNFSAVQEPKELDMTLADFLDKFKAGDGVAVYALNYTLTSTVAGNPPVTTTKSYNILNYGSIIQGTAYYANNGVALYTNGTEVQFNLPQLTGSVIPVKMPQAGTSTQGAAQK